EDDAGPKSVEAQPQLWNPDGWPLHGPALLLLVTRGLEDVAVEVLLRRGASALRQLEARRLQQPQHHHDTDCLSCRWSACPGLASSASLRSQRSCRSEASGPCALFDSQVRLPALEGRLAVLPTASRRRRREAAGVEGAPNPEEGEAFVGKVLLRLDGLAAPQRRALVAQLLRWPLVQGVLACLAVATHLRGDGARKGRGGASTFHGALAQVQDLVAAAPRWDAARALHREVAACKDLSSSDIACEVESEAAAGGSGSCRDVQDQVLEAKLENSGGQTFRASCVRDGVTHSGYRSQDVMAAMGAGALSSNPDWDIDLYDYDVEVLGFFSGDVFACGLWLGDEWRVNSQGKVQNGPDRQFHVVPVGDRRPYLPHDVRNLPRLRPSTALLLTLMGKPCAGEVLLDPFGGVGTIAVEAACHFKGLSCITSDKDPSAFHTASAHWELARKSGVLQPGCSVESRHWDARRLKLPGSSVDLVVSDLPFLNRCAFDFKNGQEQSSTSARVGLAGVLRELSRVLRGQRRGEDGGPGRAVLLVQSRRMLEDALRYSEPCGLKLMAGTSQPNPRPVVIGGAACWVFLLQQERTRQQDEQCVARARPMHKFRKRK
ncbi:unnamed protein product, partial [Polarella glacialis]